MNFKLNLLFLLFFIFGLQVIKAQTQPSQVKQPAFLRSDEKLDKTINGSIFVTSYTKDTRIFKDSTIYKRIYFTDSIGKVLNVFNFFPSNSQPISSYFRNKKKFIHVMSSYYLGKELITKDILLDFKGNIYFRYPIGSGTEITNGDLSRIAFVGSLNGILQIYDDQGKLIKNEKYSNLIEAPEDTYDEDPDPLIMCPIRISEDKNYFCLTRVWGDKGNFYELTLLNFDGRILFQKTIKNWQGNTLNVSDKNKIVTVNEINQPKGPYRYVGYNFQGKLVWVTQKPHTGFKEVSKDMRYLILVNGNKLDMKTGEVIEK